MVDTKGIKKQQKQDNNQSAVYPFELDVPAFGERKYIAGISKMVILLYISILISIFLIAFSVFRANNRKVYPRFIRYNKKENTFEFINTNYNNENAKKILNLNQRYYIEESFLRNYLKKRFEISNDFGINYNNWCDCKDDKKLSKSGIFNLNGKCYLCNVMTDKLYKDFYDFDYNNFNSLMGNNIIRNIDILEIKQINFFETIPQKSMLSKILDKYILSKNSNTTTTAVYKVVFILEQNDKNKITTESFVGYITINGIKDADEIKTITDESYMFHQIKPEVLKKLYDKN